MHAYPVGLRTSRRRGVTDHHSRADASSAGAAQHGPAPPRRAFGTVASDDPANGGERGYDPRQRRLAHEADHSLGRSWRRADKRWPYGQNNYRTLGASDVRRVAASPLPFFMKNRLIVLPKTTRVAVIFDPENSGIMLRLKAIETAALKLAIEIQPIPALVPNELSGELTAAARKPPNALFVFSPIYAAYRNEVVGFATTRKCHCSLIPPALPENLVLSCPTRQIYRPYFGKPPRSWTRY